MSDENLAQSLIERSVSHTEIVFADWAQSLADALRAECDGDTDGNDCHEYWGTTNTGEWRVHLNTDAIDARIEILRTEAGDMAQVAICDRALSGDDAARSECARVITDATLAAIDPVEFQDFEAQALSIGDELLPACAIAARDTGTSTPEYRQWLAAQWEEASENES